MIENKNTPEKFAKSDKLVAPKHGKNWDSVHSWTGSPGIFIPVKSWDLPKNASVTLRPLTQFETLPTVSPLKGHYIQRYEYFFCPYRNYIPQLSNDNVNELDNIENITFPLTGLGKDYVFGNELKGRLNIINNGHLYKYLGYPTLTLVDDVVPDNPTSHINVFSISSGPAMPYAEDALGADVSSVMQSLIFNNLAPSEYQSILDNSLSIIDFFVKPDSSYNYKYNAVPFLAYIDIFMNFVANPSENYVYNIATTMAEEKGLFTSLQATPFKVMQAIIPAVRLTGKTVIRDIPDENGNLATYYLSDAKYLASNTSSSDFVDVFMGFYYSRTQVNSTRRVNINPFVSFIEDYTLEDDFSQKVLKINKRVDDGTYYNHEGMFLVPYLPDYFSTWLDPDDIQFSRQIVSSDMSVQSLRLAERKWADFGRQLVNRSKRYTSWLETAFGVNGPTLNISNKPIWVGRDDIMVNFQNITSNAETDKTSYTGSLGSNVSRANFKTNYNDVKPIRFTTQEPGLLMCVSYIVPEVSYGKGVDKFLLKRKIGDLYRVPYDAIGFQTTDSRELDAGCSNPGINIGYNISWVEYMTKVNTHVGLFNTTPFRSWLLSRETIESDTVPMPGVPTKPDKWYLQNSTYIDPDMFNHSFVNIGQGIDNFIVQTLFNFECKLPMSNQILNTRW